MTAKLDWLLAYQGAVAGAYGDQSAAVLARIKEAAGADFDEAIAKGYITGPTKETTNRWNETGAFEEEVTTNQGVNWDKLPAMPRAPDGTYLFNIGGRAGDSLRGDEFGFIDDPNYGRLGIRRSLTPKDWGEYGPMLIASAFFAPAAAGMLGAGLGLTAGTFAQTALTTAVKGGLSLAFGQKPSLLGTAASLLKPSFVDFIKGP